MRLVVQWVMTARPLQLMSARLAQKKWGLLDHWNLRPSTPATPLSQVCVTFATVRSHCSTDNGTGMG